MRISTLSRGEWTARRRPTPLKMSVSRVVNMRRLNRQPDVFVPMGHLQAISQRQGVPVFTFTPRNTSKTVTFWLDGLELSATVTAATSPEAALTAERKMVCTLPAQPIDFRHFPEGIVKVLLSHHTPVYISYDADMKFTAAQSQPRFPALQLLATNVQTLRVQAAGRTLTGTTDGRSEGTLSAADNSLLVASALEAYKALKSQTRDAGRFLQPVLARYRILDPDGETLVCGPWLMVASENGFQCTGAVRFPSSDSMASVGDAAVQASTFVLQLSAIPAIQGVWSRIASRLVVEVSPQIDPVTPKEPAGPGYVSVDVTKGVSTARIYLPGSSPTKAESPGLFRGLVTDALSGVNISCSTLFAVDNPFNGCGASTVSSLSSTPEAAPLQPQRSYSAATRLADTLFLCNPREHRRPPCPLEAFAAEKGSTGGRWSVIVSTPRGTLSPLTLADMGRTDTALPAKLSPLLAVPDEKATELTICTSADDGTTCSRTFPLHPVAGSGYACYIDPALKPIELPAGEYAPLRSNPPCEAQAGVVHCFAGSASVPVEGKPCAGAVIAMRESPRHSAGWDFARRRMVVFATDGIWLSTYTDKGELRSSAPLDPRIVASADCVVSGTLTAANSQALVAVASDALLRITAAGTEVIDYFTGVTSAGWDITRREIWLATPQGLRVVTPQGDTVEILDDALPRSATYRIATTQLPGTGALSLLISGDGKLMRAGEETPPSLRRCILTLEGTAEQPVRRIEAWITATQAVGSVSVRGVSYMGEEILWSHAAGAPALRPLDVSARLPFRRDLRLTLDARLPADARVSVPR